ncbi:hypothetical protein PPL_01351 [Heterostelium album PN500]|uniref:Uncharacterized protein n=1 Tax=Heterostelium pallidum (strain ATCC 26659 / Pp 5 / PN500) TaxID=670386 RepID=D3AZ11_HETP5|nr:hypothetical protein PPL_01351 [Heterostelium album PN500]EFA85568.1 hypothetical protein PPL_01351 [Heterostelium album PN500]|eukprot:XP_020437675.1 hypothetical protein PPL_01351 [Heterostelium album PN500]
MGIDNCGVLFKNLALIIGNNTEIKEKNILHYVGN